MNETEIKNEQAAVFMNVTAQTIYNRQSRGSLSKPVTLESIMRFVDSERAKLDAIENKIELSFGIV